jgi:hypothetical protein
MSQTCRQTMKKRTPQAMGTFFLSKTIVHPPNWPKKLMRTNIVAKNQPQPQEMSIYSLCSDHWNHIRRPSSKNVEIRHSLVMCGRILLPLRRT